MPLISIIIPVFNNSRKQLRRCLDSIQNQTFSNYEVLIIDDGSNLTCNKEIDAEAEKISCCRVIHKEHEGVSIARNTGVKLATGKFITFVDADDMLVPNFLEEALAALLSTNVDIVYGFVQLFNSTEEIGNITKKIDNKNCKQKIWLLAKNEIRELYCHMFDLSNKKFWQGKSYISRGPVARVVKKELVESCRFDPTLFLGQDAVWNLTLLQKTEKAAVVNSIWYNYLRNTGSASQNFDDQFKKKSTVLMERLWALANDKDSRKACLGKTFEIIKTLTMKYYLTGNFKGNGIISAVNDFNRLLNQKPWNVMLQYSNVTHAGWKIFLKYLLLKMNLLFPIYAVRKRLHG